MCRGFLAAVACWLVTAPSALAAPDPPTLTAAFSPSHVNPGGTSTVTFTLANPPSGSTLTNVSFSDSFPTLGGAVIPEQNAATNCPGATAGTGGSGGGGGGGSQVAFTDPSLAAGAECQITVSVFALQTGTFTTTSDPLTADGLSNGPTASAQLIVANPPQLSAALGSPAINVGDTTTVSITVVDANPNVALSGVGFTGTLTAGLEIASPSGVTTSCPDGSASAAAGGSAFALTGATLTADQSCSVSFAVTGTAPGSQEVSIAAPTSVEGGKGSTATTKQVAVLGPPTITFAAPTSGAVYELGSPVSAAYSCADDANGPGISSCSGTLADGGALATSTPGSYAFSVTAVSSDGQRTEQTISYSVQQLAPRNTSRPAIVGKAAPGTSLSCGTGTWSDAPTAFSLQWRRNGTVIAGATAATYAVRQLDQGSSLACTVAASDPAGTGTATSASVTVPVTPRPGCPAVAPSRSATGIGPVRLGMTRAAVRGSLPGSSMRRRRESDTFCLTPAGIEVGYAGARAVWIGSAAPLYGVRGVFPGASLAEVQRRFPHGTSLTLGASRWYVVVAGRPVSAIFEARGGAISAVAVADRSLTTSRTADRSLIRAFG